MHYLGYLDYVYFFYGFAFIVLGAVCFSVLRRSADYYGLPWWWFGLFASFHGFSKWMKMTQISFAFLADHEIFKIAYYLVLLLSYICLLEFARRATSSVLRRKVGAECYIFLSIFVLLGFLRLRQSPELLINYFLGILGCIWSAIVLLRYEDSTVKKTTEDSLVFLRICGLCIFLYGLLIGFDVPKGDFFSATKTNASFLDQYFNFPIEFFSGVIAFFMAVSILIFSVKENTVSFFKGNRKITEKFTALCLSSLIVYFILFGAGWYEIDNYTASFEKRADSNRYIKSKIFIQLLDITIAKLRAIDALTSNPEVVSVFHSENYNDTSLNSINERLDRYRSALSADVCYLMDKSGLTIASSNRNTPVSFIGKNYSFRPYFKKASEGSNAVYMARGVTSKERGVYVSSPIKFVSPEGKKEIVGVGVAKATINRIEEAFAAYPYVFLMSPEGVIFISSKNEWVFSCVSDLSDELKNIFKDSRQFGEGPWKNLGFTYQIYSGKKRIFIEGKPYDFTKENIEALPGWYILFIDDLSDIMEARFRIIMIFAGSSLLLLVFSMLVFKVYQDKLDTLASESLYEALVESSPDNIMLFDKAANCVSVNKSGLSMMDLDKKSIIGKNFIDMWPQEHQSVIKQAVKGVLKGSQQLFKATMKRENGEIFIKSVILAPIYEANGAVKYFIGILRDITEERRAMDQLIQSSRMATVGALATGVSHEFNNVLEIIISNAEIAYESGEVSSMKDALKIAIDSAKRAARIVQSMLDFSKKSYEPKAFVDMASLIRQNIVFLNKVFEDNGIIIETRFKDLPKIYCNATQISQVFVNILMNAKEAMRTTKDKKLIISLDCNLERSEIVICFEDTGIGISDEIKDKIFAPFVTTKGVLGGGDDEQHGIGLGLFIAYGIIKQHSGDISIDSNIGSGTKVCVVLPIFSK